MKGLVKVFLCVPFESIAFLFVFHANMSPGVGLGYHLFIQHVPVYRFWVSHIIMPPCVGLGERHRQHHSPCPGGPHSHHE